MKIKKLKSTKGSLFPNNEIGYDLISGVVFTKHGIVQVFSLYSKLKNKKKTTIRFVKDGYVFEKTFCKSYTPVGCARVCNKFVNDIINNNYL